jgi:hypothetical protein
MEIRKDSSEIWKIRVIIMGYIWGSGETNSEGIESFWREFDGQEYRHGTKLWQYQHVMRNNLQDIISLWQYLFESYAGTRDNHLKYFAGSNRIPRWFQIENSSGRAEIRKLDRSPFYPAEPDLFERLFQSMWELHPESGNRQWISPLEPGAAPHLLSSAMSSLRFLFYFDF